MPKNRIQRGGGAFIFALVEIAGLAAPKSTCMEFPLVPTFRMPATPKLTVLRGVSPKEGSNRVCRERFSLSSLPRLQLCPQPLPFDTLCSIHRGEETQCPSLVPSSGAYPNNTTVHARKFLLLPSTRFGGTQPLPRGHLIGRRRRKLHRQRRGRHVAAPFSLHDR